MDEIDIPALAEAIPPRIEGDDRMVYVFVVDRPDPEGEDAPLDDNVGAQAGAALVQALADWVGTTPEKITCLAATTNAEVASDGPVTITGADLITLAEVGIEPDPEG